MDPRMPVSCFRIILLSLSLMALVSAPAGAELRIQPFTGALRLERTDISFEGSRAPLDLVRYFQGRRLRSTPFGMGWRHSFQYEILVQESDKEIVLWEPSGDAVVFKHADGNRYEAGPARGTAKVIGSRVKVELPGGLTLRFDDESRLTGLTNSYGQKVALTYERGRLKKVAGPFGEWLSFEHFPNGLVKRVGSSLGHAITYTYTKKHQLERVRRDGKVVERYRSESNGLLRAMAFRSYRNLIWKFDYDEQGRVIRRVSPQGYVSKYEYLSNEVSRTFVTIGPGGGRTLMIASVDGTTRGRMDPEGGTRTSHMDPQTGNLLKVVASDGGETTYTYDKKGRLAEVVDPIGRRVRYSYVRKGWLPKKIADDQSGTTKFTYDAHGEWVRLDHSIRGRAQRRYDERGRLVYELDTDGSERHLSYGNGWVPETVKDSSGREFRNIFDEKGRATSFSVDNGKPVPLARARELVKEQAAFQDLLRAKDAGKLILLPDGKSGFEIDRAGRIVRRVYRSGMVRRYTYDSNGKVVKVTQDGKPHEKNVYDDAGRLAERIDADGAKTRFTMDKAGRAVASEYPGGLRETVEYDAQDRPVRYVSGKTTVEYGYDKLGTLLSANASFEDAPKAGGEVSYSYRKDGKLASVGAPHAKIGYAWDESGKLREVSDKRFGEFEFDYDGSGGITAIRYPNGTVTRFSPGDGKLGITVERGADRLLEIGLSGDEKGRVVRREVDGVKARYTYDRKDQLTIAAIGGRSWKYRYDAWGNRIREVSGKEKVSSKFAKDGRLLSRGKTGYTWDARGSLAARKGPEGRAEFEFDRRDNMLRQRAPSGAEIRYGYYPTGLMSSREEGGVKRFIHYIAVNPVAEVDPDGKLVRRYLYSPEVNKLLAFSEGERDFFVHRDERDNVVLVTDETGAVAAKLRYGPFGEVLERSGEVVPPMMFAGLRAEAGLYYARRRFYDPETGRFLSRDPLEGSLFDPLSTNPYLYVRNDPINNTDPMGLRGGRATKLVSMFSSRMKGSKSGGGDVEEYKSAGQRFLGYVTGKAKDKSKEALSGGAHSLIPKGMRTKEQEKKAKEFEKSAKEKKKTLAKVKKNGPGALLTQSNIETGLDTLVTDAIIPNLKRMGGKIIEKDGKKFLVLDKDSAKFAGNVENFYKGGKYVIKAFGDMGDAINGKKDPAEMVFTVVADSLDLAVDLIAPKGPLAEPIKKMKEWTTGQLRDLGKEIGANNEAVETLTNSLDAWVKNNDQRLVAHKVHEIAALMESGTLEDYQEAMRLVDGIEEYAFNHNMDPAYDRMLDKIKLDVDKAKQELLSSDDKDKDPQPPKQLFVSVSQEEIQQAQQDLDWQKDRDNSQANQALANQSAANDNAAQAQYEQELAKGDALAEAYYDSIMAMSEA
ncbi:RHS repeat-associated core domain-containing protein, partial [Elusimicrobiota bacterium]